jgi:hypothetical protein
VKDNGDVDWASDRNRSELTGNSVYNKIVWIWCNELDELWRG